MNNPEYNGKSIWLIALEDGGAGGLISRIGPKKAEAEVRKHKLEHKVKEVSGDYRNVFIRTRINVFRPSPVADDKFDGIVFNMLRDTTSYFIDACYGLRSTEYRLPDVGKAAVLYNLANIAKEYAENNRSAFYSAQVLATEFDE
jgi:hypothetical protein